MATDAAQAARHAHDRVTPVEAVAGHAGVAEGEVVLHRIGGVEHRQTRGDLLHQHIQVEPLVPRPAFAGVSGPLSFGTNRPVTLRVARIRGDRLVPVEAE